MTCLGEVSGKSWTSRGSLGEVRVMEFGIKRSSECVSSKRGVCYTVGYHTSYSILQLVVANYRNAM